MIVQRCVTYEGTVMGCGPSGQRIPGTATEPCASFVVEGVACETALATCTTEISDSAVTYCGIDIWGYQCRGGAWHEIRKLCPR